MSEDSVGVVRGAYEAWNRHGPAAIELLRVFLTESEVDALS